MGRIGIMKNRSSSLAIELTPQQKHKRRASEIAQKVTHASVASACLLPTMVPLSVLVFVHHIVLGGLIFVVILMWRMIVRYPLERMWNLLRPYFTSDQILLLESQMAAAKNYEQWCVAAEALDKAKDRWIWKKIPDSDLYDWKRIKRDLVELRVLVDREAIYEIMQFVRARLQRNIGNVNDRRLWSFLHVGSKELIEQYQAEVVRALQLICVIDTPAISETEKLQFFKDVSKSYGKTALMLSGGGLFTLHQLPIIHELLKAELLPKILTGSSFGSFMCGIIGTRTDEELIALLENNAAGIFHEYYDVSIPVHISSLRLFYDYAFKLNWKRFGVIGNSEWWEKCIAKNIPDWTFDEARRHSGRIINISVSCTDSSQKPLVCNYLNTPHVLIRSAILASSALPFVYPAQPLFERWPNSHVVPYRSEQVLFVDGSVQSDMPMNEIQALFGVNCAIAVQVNPHLAISYSHAFMTTGRSDWHRPLDKLADVFFAELKRLILCWHEIGIPLPSAVKNMLMQQYHSSDLTIVPNITLDDFILFAVNPDKERLASIFREGRQAIWKHMSMLKSLLETELVIEECLHRMRNIITESQRVIASVSKPVRHHVDENRHASNNDEKNGATTRRPAGHVRFRSVASRSLLRGDLDSIYDVNNLTLKDHDLPDKASENDLNLGNAFSVPEHAFMTVRASKTQKLRKTINSLIASKRSDMN